MEPAVVGREGEPFELGPGVVAVGDPPGPGRLELDLALVAERPEVVDDVADGPVGEHGRGLVVGGVDGQPHEALERVVDHRAGSQVGAGGQLVVDGAERHRPTVAVPGISRHGRYAYYTAF